MNCYTCNDNNIVSLNTFCNFTIKFSGMYIRNALFLSFISKFVFINEFQGSD